MQTDTFQTIGTIRKHQDMFYLLDSSQDKHNLSISDTHISLPHFALINNVSPCNLWHMKCGHPSNKILQLLISDHSDIFFLMLLLVMLVLLSTKMSEIFFHH